MKIAVIGLGNMGAWLAQRFALENELAVFDLDPARMEKFREVKWIKVMDSLSGLKSFEPALLINAVSLHNTVDAFRAAEEFLSKGCILCDIASIKGEIPQYYEQSQFPFVSVHPMFGPTFADLGSIKEENAVIIKESCPEGQEFFKKFFEGLGVTIFYYSAEEHDDMMGYSLTLPFVSSMVFAASMKEKAVPGSTFARHRKIARGLLSEEDRLLAEILFNKYSVGQLDKVTSRLEFLKHIIRGKDFDEARRFFDKLRENIC